MIRVVKQSRIDLKRIVAQNQRPHALPRVSEVADPAACAATTINATPAHETQTDASIKADTDNAYAVTEV